MTQPLVARGLCHRIGGRIVLDDVSLALADGDLAALLGANGAGKTTLLRILLGLQHPGSGQVLLDGRPLGTIRRAAIAQRLAYVPQAHVPVFPYRVGDVVALGRLAGATFGRGLSPDDRRIADAALQRLGIARLADRPYTQLSGGERQSVLIARALAQGARILILDEPATGLDFGQQLRLSAMLRSLANEGYAILSTTHDPLRARTAFDRVVMLQQGRVIEDGPAALTITDDAIRRLYGLAADQALPGAGA